MENINADGWSNVLTIILLIVTGAYVYLTWRIANANQLMLRRSDEQHRELTRPTVYAYLDFRDQVVVRLVIQNMGQTPAYDLKIELDRDIYQFADKNNKNLRDMALFRDMTSWLPPGAKIPIDLTQGFTFDKEINGEILTPSKFDVSLSYRSKFDKYSEVCNIDLAPYFNINVKSTTAEEAKKVADQIKKLAER